MKIVDKINDIEIEISGHDPKIPDRFDIRIGDTLTNIYLTNIPESDWDTINEFVKNCINFIKANNERKSIGVVTDNERK